MKRFNVLFSVILLTSLTCSNDVLASKNKLKGRNSDEQQSSNKGQKINVDDDGTPSSRPLSDSDKELFDQLEANLFNNSSSSSSKSDNTTYTAGQRPARPNLFSTDPMQRQPNVNWLSKQEKIYFGFNPDEKGESVEQNQDGNTMLHLASQNGFHSTANLLLHYGIDISPKNNDGKTPLDIAIETKDAEMKQLLKTNLNLFKHAKAGCLPGVIKACLAGASVNATQSIEMRRNFTPLHMAALGSRNNTAVVKFLIDTGALVNVKTSDNNIPLHYAALRGYRAITKLLLKAGELVNTKNTSGNTPLFLAASNGHQAVVTLLLEAKALVNVQTNYRQTPLHGAATEGRETVVPLLLAAGALVNEQDLAGNTPLHLAAASGNQTVVQQLLGAGADRTLVNNEGKTPLIVAQENDDLDIFELLRD